MINPAQSAFVVADIRIKGRSSGWAEESAVGRMEDSRVPPILYSTPVTVALFDAALPALFASALITVGTRVLVPQGAATSRWSKYLEGTARSAPKTWDRTARTHSHAASSVSPTNPRYKSSYCCADADQENERSIARRVRSVQMVRSGKRNRARLIESQSASEE